MNALNANAQGRAIDEIAELAFQEILQRELLFQPVPYADSYSEPATDATVFVQWGAFGCE